MRPIVPLLAVLLSVSLAFITTSGAQAQIAAAKTKVILSEALEDIIWNPAQRGPLLAVDPARVAALTQNPDALPTGRRTTNLTAVAPFFSRRVVPIGGANGLTVLSPETMMVLNTHPEQQVATAMARDAACRRLFQSFDQGQWRQIGSNQGIGAEEMKTDEQRRLFRVLSASPMPLLSLQAGADRQKLSPKQLTGLRLRIQRSVLAQMTMLDSMGQEYAGPVLPTSKVPGAHFMVDPSASQQQERESSGKWAYRTERNRPKPGDLDFASANLNAAVRLAGIKTIGNVVKRCATATHQELYVDGRMARLPFYVRAEPNASVRAGDLLQGLCSMVTGAFRRVRSGTDAALVLTDDRAGYGTRMARIARVRLKEFQEAQVATSMSSQEMPRVVPALESWRLLSDSSDMTFTPEGAIREALDNAIGGVRVPPEELPDSIRQQITKATELHRCLPLRQDTISVRIVPRMEYLVPGVAPIWGLDERRTLSYFRPLVQREPLPESGIVPVPLDVKMRTGLTLIAAPSSLDEAERIVRLAAEKAIPHVWLQGEVETVRAGVAAGQQRGVMVHALISLLRTQSGATTVSRDPNIFNEASEWLLPESPETLAKMQRDLHAYAAIPGLAGITLTDTAAPGCDVPEGDLLAEDGSETGYTPERRLAYLRSTGFDPIDLVRGQDTPPLPFLRDKLGWDETQASQDKEMLQANRGWGAVRYSANLALLRRLYDDMRVMQPAPPVLVRSRGALRHWYGSWDTPEGLPYYRVAGHPAPATLFDTAHRQSLRMLLGITHVPGQYVQGQLGRDTRYPPLPDGPASLARTINLALEAHKGPWDGLVMDLRTVPLLMLPELLAGVSGKK